MWRLLGPALCVLYLSGCGDDSAGVNNNQNNDNQSSLLCGNGQLEGAEECDDGPDNSDTVVDACRSNCLEAHCGDGVLDTGEVCDDGVANSDLVPDACRQDCTAPTCGDAVVDVQSGEQCDDGNALGGDGCNEDCVPEFCGNGYVEVGEVCDDGNFAVGDGCSASCQSDETCGNAIVDFAVGESCDDGNAASHDGCGSNCAGEVPVWLQWWHGWGARAFHAQAFMTSRRRLIVFGGLLYGFPYNDTWQYDSVRWWRVQPTRVPLARHGHRMVYDPHRDRIVMFGGLSGPVALADTWEFDGEDWTEVTPTVSPPARYGYALVYDLHRRRIVLFGGQDGPQGNRLADTWEFDGQQWTQRSPSASPSARDGHGMAYDPIRKRTVLFGGETSGGLSDETWEYDGTTWVEDTTLATSPPPRRDLAMEFNPYETGVAVQSGFGGNGALLDDLWSYDGNSWQSHSWFQRPAPRYGHTLSLSTTGGDLLLVGGQLSGDAGTAAEADTWALSDTGWNNKRPPFLPPERSVAAMAWDTDRGRMVLYGGEVWLNSLQDTWEYDGVQWYEVPTPDTAGRRGRHAMVYHEAQGETVLFGGQSAAGVDLGTTAVYDGTTWTPLTLSNAPDPRYDHAMVYDTQRQVAVLFGGDGGGLKNDTWEYDGASWTEVVTANAPSPRRRAAMAYDRARGRVVLFGGLLGAGLFAGDTWEYDGTNWSEVTTTQAPAPRYLHGMAYHETRGRVMLFGGLHTALEQDTWEYDPDNALWWAIGTAEAPTPRQGTTLAFDPVNRGVVLFGGYDGSLVPWLRRNDTWYYGYDSVVPEEQCDNGTDDDTDQLVDCDDPDCAGRSCGAGDQTCVGGVCVCAGGVTSESDCGDGVDEDCDGLTDCADSDCSSDAVCETAEQSCSDTFDNDGDGYTDCEDPDCAVTPACTGGLCADWIPLYCDSGQIGSNLGGPTDISNYGCGPVLTGRESVYRFVSPVSGPVTGYLYSPGSSLRLVVVWPAGDGSCDPGGQCIGSVLQLGYETVDFTAVAGEVYYFVVDSLAPAAEEAFVVSVLCNLPVPG